MIVQSECHDVASNIWGSLSVRVRRELAERDRDGVLSFVRRRLPDSREAVITEVASELYAMSESHER